MEVDLRLTESNREEIGGRERRVSVRILLNIPTFSILGYVLGDIVLENSSYKFKGRQCFCCFVFALGPHLVAFRDYSWLFAQK